MWQQNVSGGKQAGKLMTNASFNPEPTATALAAARVNAGYQAAHSQTVAVGSGLNEALQLCLHVGGL
jgi:hypothetical protein